LLRLLLRLVVVVVVVQRFVAVAVVVVVVQLFVAAATDVTAGDGGGCERTCRRPAVDSLFPAAVRIPSYSSLAVFGC
jgi:hypothetical protein